MEIRHTNNKILKEIIIKYHYEIEHELNNTIDRIKDLKSQLNNDIKNEYLKSIIEEEQKDLNILVKLVYLV